MSRLRPGALVYHSIMDRLTTQRKEQASILDFCSPRSAEEAASKAQRESKMAALKAQAAAQGKSAGPKLPEAVTPLKLQGVARPPEPEPESLEGASCSSTDSEEE